MKFRDIASDFVIGCGIHSFLTIAAAILLGSAAYYWGLSGRTLYVLIAIVLFFGVIRPWLKTRQRM
jgi:hypothetical protein